MNCAGLSSAPAEDSLMERSKEKKERRSSLPLPTPTAATNQGARLAANNIISNVLQQLAPRQEVADMDTSGSGTAEPKPDGAGTALGR